MADNLTSLVEDLIDFGYGDAGRLDSILNALKQGRHLYSSDQKYVDILVSKYLFPPGSDAVEKLREEIKSLNEKYEKAEHLGDKFRGSTKYKSEGTALVLAMFFGFFGFMGLGHRYVGNIVRSLAALYSGCGLFVLNTVNFFPSITSNLFHQKNNTGSPFFLGLITQSNLSLDPYLMTAIAILVWIGPPAGYFAFYIWQIFNSRNLTKEFNEFMDKTGNQLYAITYKEKIFFATIASAPIVAVTINYFVSYADSLKHFIGL